MATIYGLRRVDEQPYFYVGSTKFSADHRFKAHMADVRLGNHANRSFVDRVNRVGSDNITVDVLQEVPDVERYDVEREWILRLIGEGHKLVNRVYVDIDPSLYSGDKRAAVYTELTPERFRWAYEISRSEPPVAKDPSMQDVLNGVHGLVRLLLDEMVRRFPDQAAVDFGFVAAQENAS